MARSPERDARFIQEFGDTRLPLHSAKLLPSVSEPIWLDAGQDGDMRDRDDLLGVVHRGIVRAYPTWIMDNVHMVNDEFGPDPLLVIH